MTAMLPARANPFRAGLIERLGYQLDDAGWKQLLARFAAQHMRGVLVGPHGSGKTTLREELAWRLEQEGWRIRTLVPGAGRAPTWAELRRFAAHADARTLLSIDGLDRIGALGWWHLRRMAGSGPAILATSHVHGRLPTLHEHRTSPELLHDLVAALVPASVSPGLRERCSGLFARHHGNVRACLRELYNEWAEHGAYRQPPDAATRAAHCTSRSA